MGEREAIRRLKQLDIGGLEYLVLKYQVQAVQAAYLVCRDRALAEDIVQSAFINAYERIGGFDEARPFGPWFLRSVVNGALKAGMKRGRTVSLELSLETSLPQSATPLAYEEVGLEERIESLETSAAINAAIAQLPPKQRAAIVLRYYLEMGDAEMSEELDCAPGTVRWRLHEARERLRRLLPPWVVGASEPQTASNASAMHVAAHEGDAP